MLRYFILVSASVLVIACAVTIGWITGAHWICSFGPSGAPMVMNTAVGLGMTAAGLLAHQSGRRRVGLTCGIVVSVLATLVLLQHFSGKDLGVEHLIWRHPLTHAQTVPGRMAPLTAGALLILGTALMVMASGRARFGVLSMMSAAILAMGLLPLLSYVIVLSVANSWGSHSGVALPTAICIVLSSTALASWVIHFHAPKGITYTLLGSAVAILFALGAVSAKADRDWTDARQLVTHTFEVNAAIDKFVIALNGLEANTRAYALTVEPIFLERAGIHRGEIGEQIARLKELTRDNPAQLRRLAELDQTLLEKLRASDAVILHRQRFGIDAAAAAVRAQIPELMVSLVRITSELRAEEERLMKLRQNAAAITGRYSRLVHWCGTAAALLLVLASTLIAHRAAAAKDVAQSKLARTRDEALQASKLKSEFLANMSHEIRTPMNGVIGMTSLLSETVLSGEQREYVETVRASGETLLVLIGDILDFSKIESGKIELENRDFEVSPCIEEALVLFRTKAHEKGVELLYSVQPHVPLTAVGDGTRIRQVVTNLLGNALKFTTAGEIEVSVDSNLVQGDADRNHELIISVRDTGIGIPVDQRHRLFQPFMQADASTNRRFGGTGLGLTISRKLAELMGGSLELADDAGPGSTFRFSCRVKGAATSRVLVPGVTTSATLRRILIVDDNEGSRRIIRSYLAELKITAVEAGTPDEALAIIATDPGIDACFVDMHLHGSSGLNLVASMRALRSDPALRFVILTAGSREDVRKTDQHQLAAAVLDKPVRWSPLCGAIKSLLQPPVTAVEAPLPSCNDVSREAPIRPYTILLAEDNAVNQLVAQRMFRRLGYEIEIAANGMEALTAMRYKAYDVVFMDVEMPIMTGMEATAALRKDRGSAQPWIVALTANAMTGDRERCLEMGMNDYVSKPVRIETLKKALQRVPEARCSEPGKMSEVELCSFG